MGSPKKTNEPGKAAEPSSDRPPTSATSSSLYPTIAAVLGVISLASQSGAFRIVPYWVPLGLLVGFVGLLVLRFVLRRLPPRKVGGSLDKRREAVTSEPGTGVRGGQIVEMGAGGGVTVIGNNDFVNMARRGFDPVGLVTLGRLHSTDPEVRAGAAAALKARGPSILPMLRTYSREEGQEYRAAIIRLIGELHPGGLIAGLVEGLKSGDHHEGWQICNCIRDLGEGGAPALPHLAEYLRQPLPGTCRFRCLAAISSIVPLGTVSVLELLVDDSISVEQRGEIAVSIADDCQYDDNVPSERSGVFQEQARLRCERLVASVVELAGRPNSAAGDDLLLDVLVSVGPCLGTHADPLRAIARAPAHRFAARAAQALEVIDGPGESLPG